MRLRRGEDYADALIRQGALRNPSRDSAASLERKVSRALSAIPIYHETIYSINDALDKALSKAGLNLTGWVDQAVPYGQTRMMILPTSHPDVYVSVQVYRTPTGRYELTTYATRESRKRRRASNPAGDIQDTLAKYLAERVYLELKPGDEHHIPTGDLTRLAVRREPESDDVVFTLETQAKSAIEGTSPVEYEWVPTSDKYEFRPGSLEDAVAEMAPAIHHALHGQTLAGFEESGSESEVVTPRVSNPSEPADPEIDAPEITASDHPVEIHDTEESAAKVYEEFHGEPSKEVIDTEEEYQFRDKLTVLGSLIQIVVQSLADTNVYKISFSEPTMLCCSPDRRQLFVVGGEQGLDLVKMGFSEIAASKDKITVGPVQQVTYRTRKSFDDFAVVDYVHDMGEDGGILPMLVYDRLNETLEFTGGDYEIKPEGIVN